MAGSRIKWHPDTREDIARLTTFLRKKQPEAAVRAARTIMDGATLLGSAPYLGRPMGDGTGRRELSISFGAGAYILRYMLDDENTTVLILRVRHSKENSTEIE